jgi:hypothetical protein
VTKMLLAPLNQGEPPPKCGPPCSH